MNSNNIKELEEVGYTILRGLVSENWIDKLSNVMEKSFVKHRQKQIENVNEINANGIALNVIPDDDLYIEFLEHLDNLGLFEFLRNSYFNSKCIINSLSALNNIPNQKNFSSNIHRDLRFYSGEFPMMINLLLMIDGFTTQNGGTYLLPYSHLDESKPTDDEFFKNAIQAVGNRGDLLLFNSNMWHAAAPNGTNSDRKALPITISKSFMKQQMDYPRAIGYDRMSEFSESIQQILGYHSRVPESIDEFYQPESKRLYKKNQD